MRINELNGGNALGFAKLIAPSAQFPIIQGGVTYPIALQDALRAGQFYIDPHAFGAKGDAVANVDGVITNGTTLTSATYQFTEKDVGKLCFINSSERTITSVSNGSATLSASVSNASAVRWLIGTDDTAAIEAAMEAARTVGVTIPDGNTSETSRWGSIPFGGLVQLRSRGYLVRNTQARYDAGKLGAITVPRRCGLRGAGMGQTHIYLAPGNIGHGIANRGSSVSGGGWDDFMQLSDFTLFGNHDLQTSACLDGIHYEAAFNNYLKVDNFTCMSNIRVYEPRRHGIYINGRGEMVYFNLFVYSAFQYGVFIENNMDSRFYSINAGGCSRTGIRINKSANIHLTNCKSFYSGNSGGTNAADSANFALIADTYLNGQVIMTACEAQESRGSGFYITSGLNIFNGCLAADPSRAALVGSSTPPTVRAGFHLADTNSVHANPKHNIFNGCYVRPALTLNYADAAATDMYCGTHAVYIDDAGRANRGDIYTFDQAAYDASKLGGPGISNGRNTGLRVDGTALT
ncbi:right-handed parallel beta-helix repeat-containing protein [Tautonia marina]|uniref:right-handed parallel beta-helix repeat-containing protein n=1 Tax=Tautonia marina TaxID=2653855 RepID=UPI0012607EBC|nr:right-handed parallel beta-helix repeat-containing protein [Tautonia marina]